MPTRSNDIISKAAFHAKQAMFHLKQQEELLASLDQEPREEKITSEIQKVIDRRAKNRVKQNPN